MFCKTGDYRFDVVVAFFVPSDKPRDHANHPDVRSQDVLAQGTGKRHCIKQHIAPPEPKGVGPTIIKAPPTLQLGNDDLVKSLIRFGFIVRCRMLHFGMGMKNENWVCSVGFTSKS